MKIGPAESIQEARRIAKMWKRRIQDNFQNQECLSGLLVCKDGHCPRSQGMQVRKKKDKNVIYKNSVWEPC